MGILICGLNGVGKSTVGKALAERLSYRFIDNEDLFFPKDEPSYEYDRPRGKAEVIHILNDLISEDLSFVFCAVRGDYGDKFLSALDHIIYIYVPRKERDRRVFNRSYEKFGDRMLEGGDLYERENSFIALAQNRPDDYVERWIETVNIPVIRIDGTRPVEENVEYLALALK
ncbi:MAG: AAA family ATPase [Clostridia bacterium]|nr:AAA family ATPase [Clostridia bacterium]